MKHLKTYNLYENDSYENNLFKQIKLNDSINKYSPSLIIDIIKIVLEKANIKYMLKPFTTEGKIARVYILPTYDFIEMSRFTNDFYKERVGYISIHNKKDGTLEAVGTVVDLIDSIDKIKFSLNKMFDIAKVIVEYINNIPSILLYEYRYDLNKQKQIYKFTYTFNQRYIMVTVGNNISEVYEDFFLGNPCIYVPSDATFDKVKPLLDKNI